jgi:hypothetical protein
MSVKELGSQYATCLTSFDRPGILVATGLTYALTVMVGRLNILPDAILFTINKHFIQSKVNSLLMLLFAISR